jgi:flavin-dependent dehydrogenase
LQQQVLYQNPHLKNIFNNSDIVNDFPITISQISFDKKSPVEQHIVMLGDAAGMITPLCGNGMSMALHSSKIATSLIILYLQKKISLSQLEQQYEQQWKAAFASRMQAGRLLQRFFGNNSMSNMFVQTFKWMPFLANSIIKKTHGTAF